MADDVFAPLTVSGLLDLLDAVVDAMDIPSPGNAEAHAVRDRILSERAREAGAVVAEVLADLAGAGEAAAHLRKWLLQRPAGGYLTVDHVCEARIAGKPASERANLPSPARGRWPRPEPVGPPEPVRPRPAVPTSLWADTFARPSAAVGGEDR